MDEMNFDLDDTLLSPTEDLGGGTIEDSTETLGASHNPFSSGFDAEHPLPSYDELRNAGFSDYLARHISEGGCHSYSDRELFHVLHESEDPVAAYNEMMEDKAQHIMDKTDSLINEIENSCLLGSSPTTSINDDTSHYNDTTISPDTPEDEQELGLADCWPLCKTLTGSVTNNANFGFHA